jgi:hypothetical protein
MYIAIKSPTHVFALLYTPASRSIIIPNHYTYRYQVDIDHLINSTTLDSITSTPLFAVKSTSQKPPTQACAHINQVQASMCIDIRSKADPNLENAAKVTMFVFKPTQNQNGMQSLDC